MRIYFMKDDALAYFKGNIDDNLHHYLNDNEWVFSKYAEYRGYGISPFEEFKFEVNDFMLEMSSLKPEDTDYNNAQILYLALRNISDTQASDERFWVGLAHSHLWEYMKYRSKLTDEKISSDKIYTNYFFSKGHKRSLTTHHLARLWWVGRLTYDPNSIEPFEALKCMKKNFSSRVGDLFSSSFTNNPVIARAILKAINLLEEYELRVSRKTFREIIKYVNALGGVIILDYLSEDELKKKIISHYFEVNNVDLNDLILGQSLDFEDE